MPSTKFSRRKWLIAGAALAGVAAAGAGATEAVLSRADFGGTPTGERLARMQASPHWADGTFHNLAPMQSAPAGRSQFAVMRDFLLNRNPERYPSKALPHQKANLAQLAPDSLVWLGHSSFYVNFQGLRILIDPALHQAFPLPGFFKPFAGADTYQPSDLPAADVLLITHDHYDHLDYATVQAIKNRVARVVCPLGVGVHFAAWGWEEGRITELDWMESVKLPGLTITAVPGQHFSGRSFGNRNQTLWAGFVLEGNGYRLYHSGDSSNGPHFAQITRECGPFDLALLEDGQYNTDWPGVHMLPSAWREAVRTLAPQTVMPIHNSKFSLAPHTWHDPLDQALQTAMALDFSLATPMIGQPLALDPASRQTLSLWWRR